DQQTSGRASFIVSRLLPRRAASCGITRCCGSAGASPSQKMKSRRFNKTFALPIARLWRPVLQSEPIERRQVRFDKAGLRGGREDPFAGVVAEQHASVEKFCIGLAEVV